MDNKSPVLERARQGTCPGLADLGLCAGRDRVLLSRESHGQPEHGLALLAAVCWSVWSLALVLERRGTSNRRAGYGPGARQR